MNRYVVYIKLPDYEDFKGVVFPNFGAEFSTKEGNAQQIKNAMMVMLETDEPVSHEKLANMWLKFDTQFMIFSKDEIDKRIVDPNYEPKPLLVINGYANNDIVDAQAKDVQQEES